MRLEVENIGLPCKSIHVIHLVVFILVTVNQINNIISLSRGKNNIWCFFSPQ